MPNVNVKIVKGRRPRSMAGYGDAGQQTQWWKWALGAGAVLLIFGGGSSSGVDMQARWFGPQAVTDAIIQDFRARVPARVGVFLEPIIQVAQEEQVSPRLIYGIGDWEGAHKWNPNQRNSDAGATAFTPYQINSAFHQPWLDLGVWTDPYEATKYAVSRILKPSYQGALQAGYNGRWAEDIGVSGYNAGLGGALKGAREGNPQRYTYGGNYLDSVYGGIAAVGWPV